MYGPGIVVFVVAPLLVVIAVVAVAVAGRQRARRLVFDEEAYPGLVVLRRSVVGFRWAGVVAGIVLGLVVLPQGRLAPAAFAAPLVTGLVVVVAILLGQRLAYGKARAAGSAGLETRRVADYVPRRLLRGVGGAVATLLVVVGFTTLAASPDDQGRPGRALSATWRATQWVADASGTLQAEEVVMGGGGSPFPGSFYTPAVLIGLALLLAVAWWGVVQTARRPRNGADPELVRVDDALRRITTEGILAATGAGAAGSVLAVAGLAYPRFGSLSAVPVYVANAYLLALVALAGLVAVVAFAVVLVVPGNGQRR